MSITHFKAPFKKVASAPAESPLQPIAERGCTVSRLSEIEQGQLVRITSFEGEQRTMGKLNRYGLYPGDLAKVVRFAPFQGPVLLEVRGMEIAVGRSIAEHILVELA